MDSISDIPDSWETKNVHVETVHEHTGEVVEESLSSTGAGPFTEEVHGVVRSRPCPHCSNGDAQMIYEAPLAALVCERCGGTLPMQIQNQPEN